jgi:hypothetical protein
VDNTSISVGARAGLRASLKIPIEERGISIMSKTKSAVKSTASSSDAAS